MTSAGRSGKVFAAGRALVAGHVVLALLVLAAACGSGGAPHQGGRSRPSPVTRPDVRAVPLTASPGPSASQPTSLQPVSATFISPATGWLLADRCGPGAQPQSCSVVMRKTTDGGRQWFPVPAPRAVPGGVPGGPAGGVAQVRFADAATGWVFGPDLWVTHDGGASWRQLSTHGLMVTSLEAADGRAVAVFTGPGPTAKFVVYTSAVGSDAWQPIPGAAGLTQGFGQDFDRNPQVAIEGSAAYVSSNGVYGYTAAANGGVLLSGPANGSAPWQRLPVPCPFGAEVQMPVAAAPGRVVLGCGGSASSGQSPKYVYTSAEGGHSWQATGPAPAPVQSQLPQPGFLDDIAVTPTGTIVASGDREAYFSWDNGATWHTPSALATAVFLGGDADQVLVGMTTSNQGFALPGPVEIGNAKGASWIWMTYDAGSTWVRISLT